MSTSKIWDDIASRGAGTFSLPSEGGLLSLGPGGLDRAAISKGKKWCVCVGISNYSTDFLLHGGELIQLYGAHSAPIGERVRPGEASVGTFYCTGLGSGPTAAVLYQISKYNHSSRGPASGDNTEACLAVYWSVPGCFRSLWNGNCFNIAFLQLRDYQELRSLRFPLQKKAVERKEIQIYEQLHWGPGDIFSRNSLPLKDVNNAEVKGGIHPGFGSTFKLEKRLRIGSELFIADATMGTGGRCALDVRFYPAGI